MTERDDLVGLEDTAPAYTTGPTWSKSSTGCSDARPFEPLFGWLR